MPVAARLAPPLQRLAKQCLRAVHVALGIQQRAEVADRGERPWVPVAERLSAPLKRSVSSGSAPSIQVAVLI